MVLKNIHVIGILLISITSLSFINEKHSKKCKLFKEGNFKIVDEETGTSYIRRSGDTQVEVMEGSTDSSHLLVTWVDDCNYILTPTAETLKKMPNLPKNAAISVKIVETTKDSYIQVSSSNFNDMQIRNEVIKIK